MIVWPLSACLLQSAVLCGSPHPSCTLARCLPAGPYRLAPHPPPPPLGPPGQEQLFQNWPTCITFTTTTPESVLSNLHFHSLCLSCKVHFSQRWRRLMCVFVFFFWFSLIELPVCIFLFYCCKKFADIVAVIIDDIVDDCFLMIIHGFLILVFMQCSASLLPLPLPPRQSQCVDQRYTSVVQQGRTKHCRSQWKSKVGGGLNVGASQIKWERLCNQRFCPGWWADFPRPSWGTKPRLGRLFKNTHTSFNVDAPHSRWCFMFNSGSTQLCLEPPQLITAFHFYAKTRRCSFAAI